MKTSFFLVAMIVFVTTNCRAQKPPASFSHLSTVQVERVVYVHYSKSLSTLIDKTLPDKYGMGIRDRRILETRFDQKSTERFFVDFTEGPSGDPAFVIYKIENDSLIYIDSIAGLETVIPGNGSVYISGHANTMFNKKRKYEFANNQFVEIRQPFYDVDLETVTLKSTDLYADTLLTGKVASLSENAPIRVLVNHGDFYLVRTSLGLIGWIKILDGSFQNDSPIKGIFWAGD